MENPENKELSSHFRISGFANCRMFYSALAESDNFRFVILDCGFANPAAKKKVEVAKSAV
jgi:hypothetical protein